jgi:uncharacterized protein YndB with AHSA1/START domain
METANSTIIKVETVINAKVDKVWKLWNGPQHITKWNNASDDWHTPKAEVDLKEGGKFLSRMESKDGKMGFDFVGTYSRIVENKQIEYTMEDGRKVQVIFHENGNSTKVTESFDAESMNSVEMQKAGWQAILDNFKKYVESYGNTTTLHFEISINAKAMDVYNKMIDDKSYRQWTALFNPSSFYEGTWEKGSKILFVGFGEDGEKGGMVSRIKENIPGKFISIEHLGMLKGDIEILDGPDVEIWQGALENYTFTEVNGATILSIDLDSNEEYKNYFDETWPKALKELKSICEA